MVDKKTLAPRRASNSTKQPQVTKAQLARSLRRIRERDPVAYRALLVVISRLVENSST